MSRATPAVRSIARRTATVGVFALGAIVVAVVSRRIDSTTAAIVGAALAGAALGAGWLFVTSRALMKSHRIDVKSVSLATLDATPLFTALPQTLKEHMAEASQIEICRAGDRVVEEGAPADSCFIVRRGRLHVFVRDGDSQISVAELREGDLFGEMSLLTGEPRWATVTAKDDTEVIRIHASALRKALIHSPDLLHDLADTVAVRRDELLQARALFERSGSRTDPAAIRRFLQSSGS